MSDEIERLCERLERRMRPNMHPETWDLRPIKPDEVSQEAAAALRALQARAEADCEEIEKWFVEAQNNLTRAEAAEAALVEARAAALEEAAKVVEAEGRKARKYPDEAVAESYCDDAAIAIRALAAKD